MRHTNGDRTMLLLRLPLAVYLVAAPCMRASRAATTFTEPSGTDTAQILEQSAQGSSKVCCVPQRRMSSSLLRSIGNIDSLSNKTCCVRLLHSDTSCSTLGRALILVATASWRVQAVTSTIANVASTISGCHVMVQPSSFDWYSPTAGQVTKYSILFSWSVITARHCPEHKAHACASPGGKPVSLPRVHRTPLRGRFSCLHRTKLSA